MNYNTVYVGMDVHKENFTLYAYTIDAEKGSHFQRTETDCKNVLKYSDFLRTVYGNDANFICGYEAGCLGYSRYWRFVFATTIAMMETVTGRQHTSNGLSH